MRAAIVLAAGASRRFGRADKLFVSLQGEPLLLHAIRSARVAPAGRVIVVAGRPGRVRALVRRAGFSGISVVAGRGRGAPLSNTLRVGVAALRPIERDAFVFLGDMPGIDPRTFRRLIGVASGRTGIVRPRFGDTPGHPVLACRVRSLPIAEGDRGFRPGPARIRWVRGGPDCVADVDRRRDLRALRRRRAVSAAG